jgi:hypothetical protein
VAQLFIGKPEANNAPMIGFASGYQGALGIPNDYFCIG